MRRGWVALVAGLVASFAVLGLLGEAFGGGPQGRVSSSYATNAQGLAAWATLLSRDGHGVEQLRTPLRAASLDPRDTLVVLDPEALLPADGTRLLSFVRAGGRLLIGGREPQSTLPALLPSPPGWTDGASTRQLPSGSDGATVAGVHEVLTAGEGEWSASRGYETPLSAAADGGNALLLQRSLGRGMLLLMADASPVQNRLLASADNAQLALDLAGPPARTVVFVESVHGFGAASGVAAIPASWWVAFAGLLAAGLAWMLARGRRLGAAEDSEDDGPPPRGDYEQALALLLRRTRQPQEISAALIRLRDRP